MSLKDIKRWYYVKQGIKRGPVSTEEMGRMIEAGDLPPADVRVWREGSVDWMALTDVKVFRKNLLRAGWSFEDPLVPNEDLVHKETDLLCRGLNRVGYNVFFYLGLMWVPVMVSIGLVEARVLGWIDYEGIENAYWWQYSPLAVAMIVWVTVTMSRMKHAGYGAPSGMGLLIPVLNIGVLVMALCAPQNYLRRKNLGVGGVLCFLLLCGSVAAVIWGFSVGYLNKVEKIIHDGPGYFWLERSAESRYSKRLGHERELSERKKLERKAKKEEDQDSPRRHRPEN